MSEQLLNDQVKTHILRLCENLVETADRFNIGSLPALNAATEPLQITWTDEGQGRYSAVYDGRRVRTPDLVSRALSAVPVDDLVLREASIEDVVRELYERGRHD